MLSYLKIFIVLWKFYVLFNLIYVGRKDDGIEGFIVNFEVIKVNNDSCFCNFIFFIFFVECLRK